MQGIGKYVDRVTRDSRESGLTYRGPTRKHFCFFRVYRFSFFARKGRNSRKEGKAGGTFPLRRRDRGTNSSRTNNSSPRNPTCTLPVAYSHKGRFLTFRPQGMGDPTGNSSSRRARKYFRTCRDSHARRRRVPFRRSDALMPITRSVLLSHSGPSFSSYDRNSNVDNNRGNEVGGDFNLTHHLFTFEVRGFRNFHHDGAI